MIFDLDFARKTKCSDKEKEDSYQLIEEFITLSQKAINEGLLALEMKIPVIDNYIFKKGLELIIDGTEPAIVEEILKTCIMTGGYKGKDLLDGVIILSGILALQRGDKPGIIQVLLSAYLGEKFNRKFENPHHEENSDRFFENLKDTPHLSEATNLLVAVTDLDNRGVQRILRELETTTIVRALAGASGLVKDKIIRNTSKKMQKILIEDLKLIGDIPEEAIVVAQKKIIQVVEKLSEIGEIKDNPFGRDSKKDEPDKNTGEHSTHKFSASDWERLERPERREILPSDKILKDLGLKKGDIVLDIGAGSGYFSFPASEIVEDTGLVIASDISQDMLDIIDGRIKEREITNMHTVLTGEYDLKIEDMSVNVALLVHVFHEISDPYKFLEEIRRILQPGGSLWLIDWEKKETPMGPPMEHRIDRDETIRILKENGFEIIRSESFSDINYCIVSTG